MIKHGMLPTWIAIAVRTAVSTNPGINISTGLCWNLSILPS
ncbi:hypothetical protein XBJ1_2882 [Xenorhabdus bovienii SS-2004]|uniref:Uncharacterized protein n=1 Tax=Xenorhabdus bovienii (strain SS-2004) TaxID=406818 RepID=D3V844_XENBS|nr:hypothetical protein XBJ1_2882 [Xenorhabdus bovienii SS-2004]